LRFACTFAQAWNPLCSLELRDMRWLPFVLICALLGGCPTRSQKTSDFDLVIRHGMVYDGSGTVPRQADVGIRGQRIVSVGDLSGASAPTEVDASGMAVAPGFVNMLSWAPDSLYLDGRSLSDIKQGVTLEIFGEGDSLGPLNDEIRAATLAQQGDLKHPLDWTTLGEGLDVLVRRGVSPNVASFVGAATVREHELGFADRPPTPPELARMQDLVRAAMREGALGLGSALIYAPGTYAKTDELTALAQAAGESGGSYISHMRSEGDRLLESLDELIGIARAAHVHGEVYHFKAAGASNWPKMAQAIAKIDAARASGIDISANMYTYTAGATGLDAAMPPWVQEGGLEAWIKRLQDPALRARVIAEMRAPAGNWENLLRAAGSADKVLLVAFANDKLKPLTGKTLAEVARMRGKSPEETAIELVIEDHDRVGTVYFLMSEDNVKLGLAQPWVALGSDEGSYLPEGVFLKFQPHPRAYGNFARFLGRYVRDEHVTSLSEAIRRLSALPAHNLKLRDRGELRAGAFADIVVFDPAKIADHATFDQPQQFATGMRDVFVNGVQVLKDGEHTGAKPGQVVRGPGWEGWQSNEPSHRHPESRLTSSEVAR
jgi:N-acyl-D-amino-acid deacylase